MINLPLISQNVWRGAAIGVFCASLAAYLVEIYASFAGEGMWFYGSIVALAGMVLISLFAVGIVGAVLLLSSIPRWYQAALAAALAVGGFVLPSNTWTSIAWAAATLVLLPSLLGGGALLTWSRLTTGGAWRVPLAAAIVSAAALGGIAWWLIAPGHADDSIAAYENTRREPLDLKDPSLPGPYKVKTIYYGSGRDYYRPRFGKQADILTKPVDGTPFVLGWEGWTGWVRSYFWGFGPRELPLNAQVWVPEGPGPFPLVLIVHGNHTMSEFSDSGYGYLGRLFASQGMIAVSVDENFLNTNFLDTWSPYDEVPARGWMLLQHLAQWRRWNGEPASPFFGKVDMEHIALVGHSRGGEAVVTADAFNNLTHFPDDGTVPFDFNFSIVSLAAIAPKDGQYLPSGNATPLSNVNYFAMHGSHDGDVRSFEGTKTYSRLSFSDGGYWFKAALYIVGANHGQFNEVWGRTDATAPESLFLNTQPLMPGAEQRKIAEVYLSAFLQATLQGKKEYIPLFWDARLGQAWLPDTLFVNQFEDSKTAFVYGGKNDLDITRGTMEGTKIAASGLTLWRQQKVSLKWGDKLDNAIFAGWREGEGSLTIDLPESRSLSLTGRSVLTFSLADARENPDKGDGPYVPWNGLIDLTVEVSDAQGVSAALPLSSNSYLFPQVETQVYKADFLDTVDNSEVVFQTFRFPLSDFVKQNPALDPSALRSVRFLFDKTPYGVVIFDRIGFVAD